MAAGMATHRAMLHELKSARPVVPLTEGHDVRLAEIAVLLDRMADDAHGDHPTRERWSRLLTSLVHVDSGFATTRRGGELRAVAMAHSASWEAQAD